MGRLVLIKHCHSNLSVYYLSLFHLPRKIEKKMIKLMRNFLCGVVEGKRKMAWVAWSKICVPKQFGGLGVRSLRLINKSLLAKWMWRYSKCKTTLWRRIIQQKFKVREEFLIPTDDNSSQFKSLWKNQLKVIPTIQKHSNYTIKDRKEVNFWHDRWIGIVPLKEVFPVVYKACKHNHMAVADMIQGGRWNCVFKRRLNANENLEWDLSRRYVQVPLLQNGEDTIEIMDNFTTKRCYEILAGNYKECEYASRVWKKNILPKVSFTLWSLFHKSLATRSVLRHRGINIASDLCALCNANAETADHLLMHCPYTYGIWSYFVKAFRIAWVPPAEIQSFIMN